MKPNQPHVDDMTAEIPNYFKGGTATKVVVADFNSVFGIDEIKSLNGFMIKKLSHHNSIALTLHYINYFIEYYDLDKSFMSSYCRVKVLTDTNYSRDTFTSETFLSLLTEYVLTDKNVKRVEEMTEDNFVVNYENSEFKGNDSLKFTNEHCKLMMNISVLFKLAIPIVNQFIYLKGMASDSITDFLNDVFMCIVKLFKDNKINIYNKIFAICDSKSNTMAYKNALLWNQLYPIYGKSIPTFMIEKLLTPIIVAIIPKYIYNNSMLALNKTVIEEAIKGERGWNTPYINKEIDDIERDEDGLSNLDKVEINMIKNDESELLINKIIIRDRIEDLIRKYGEIGYDEFMYYMNEITVDEFQKNIIALVFSNHFGSTKILDFIKKDQYVKLVILMKRMLLKKGFELLPYLLSGKIHKKTRKKISSKLLSRIEPLYNSILDSKYSASKDIIKSTETIERMIYMLSYSDITIIDYELENIRGELVVSNPEVVASEVLRLISSI